MPKLAVTMLAGASVLFGAAAIAQEGTGKPQGPAAAAAPAGTEAHCAKTADAQELLGAQRDSFIKQCLANETMMEKNTLVLVQPDGAIMTVIMSNADTMNRISGVLSTMGKALDKNMLVVLGTDGKVYMLEDGPMPDGKLISEMMIESMIQ